MRRACVVLVAFLALWAGHLPAASATGLWDEVAPLGTARTAFDATTLLDGRVIVAGGAGPGAGRSTELYDPANDSWTRVGDLVARRTRHTLSRLPDGRVLAVGGRGPGGSLATAELFDPESGTWAATAPMSQARDNHTATLLSDGRVLVAGGASSEGPPVTRAVEVFDPTSETWSHVDALRVPRYNHTATLLDDGRVLVTGGFTAGAFHTPLKHSEVFDPRTTGWAVTAPMGVARAVHAAVRLPDGSVLVAGGLVGPPNKVRATSHTEIWDPETGRWRPAVPMATERRALDGLVSIDTRRFLAIGGFDDSNQLVATAESYDAMTGAWTSAGEMATPRAPVTAKLDDGRVLAIASVGRLSTTTVEAYRP